MSKRVGYRVRLTLLARLDIADIDRYTLQTFGAEAASRYATLIRQALRDIN